MKIAYNPKTAAALTAAPLNNDITFDLKGVAIYARGVKFEGTDTTYSVFKKHTSNNFGGYDGLVPVPSYTTTTVRFLREDGSWIVPTDTTYAIVSSTTDGLAPKVINTNTTTINDNYYLLASSNGTETPSWYKLPLSVFLTFDVVTKDKDGLVPMFDTADGTIDNLADDWVLTNNNGTVGWYKLPANAFKNDNTTYTLNGGIESNNYIVKLIGSDNSHATATIKTMVGATSKIDGEIGLVPKPTISLENSYLKGNGSWDTPLNNKVTLTNTTNSEEYRVLFSESANDTTITEGSRKSSKLKFNPSTGILTTTTFKGNLDGIYVNALTGYSKAEEASDLTVTDTLNIALGKLEYKADAAYTFYKNIFGPDTDDIINKYDEIVDFVDSVNEGADITDEFVTRKTELTITGEKTFLLDFNTTFTVGTSSSSPVILVNTTGGWSRAITFKNSNNSNSKSNFGVFGSGTGVDHAYIALEDLVYSNATFKVYKSYVQAPAFKTLNGKASLFVKGDGTLDSTTYLTSADLSKYLPLTGGTLTGTLTIKPTNVSGFQDGLILHDLGTGRSEGLQIKWVTNSLTEGIGIRPNENFTGLNIFNNTNYYTIWHLGNDGSDSGLDADLLDGKHASDFVLAESLKGYVTLTTSQSISGVKTFSTQLKFTVAEGTSPFTVTSTTRVTNLNADMLDGAHESSFVKFTDRIDSSSTTTSVRHMGYGYSANGWKGSGPAISIGAVNGYIMQIQQIGEIIYVRHGEPETQEKPNGFTEWKRLAYTANTNTPNVAIADKVANKLTLKVNSGTSEGTSLYTYDGSLAKTLDIKAGSNITLGTSAGVLTISSANTTYTLSGDLSGNTFVTTLTPSSGDPSRAIVPVMKGAIDSKAGQAGLVPAPALNETLCFLRGDGSWKVPIISWNDITNKPTSFTPASHNHYFLKGWSDTRAVATTPNDYYSLFKIVGIKSAGTTLGLTSDQIGAYATLIGWRGWLDKSGGYAWEIASTDKNRLYVRSGLEETWNNDWSAIAYINDLTWDNIAEKPSTFNPASHTHPTDQINILTGYTKATAAKDLAITDTLNTALGKLEYKADTAYDWIISVTANDADKYINKWQEIINFLNKVDNTEGADITDEFVTRKTALTIIGLKTFLSTSSTTGVSLILKNSGWSGNMSTAMDFYNGINYKVPNARIETKMVGDGSSGGTLIFYTLTKHASTNPNPNGLTERLRINDEGLTKITGALTVTSDCDFSTGIVKLDTLHAPTASKGTTYGAGINGLVLKSNGTTVYWASDNNSDTWRPVMVNGTEVATSTTGTDTLNLKSGTGITVSGTKVNDITITNAGVRSVTIGTGDNATKLAINTNGTTTYLTIPYATLSTKVTCTATTEDKDRPIVLTNTTNNLYYSTKATINYSTGDLKSSGSITSAGFIKNGSSNDYILLGGGNHKALADFLLESELATKELSANLTTINKSLKVTLDWMDTGITGTDLPANGTYIIQVYVHNSTDGIWYSYWSGVMSWIKDATDDTVSDEILLHRSGHTYGDTIYLRTVMRSKSTLKLLIAASKNLTTAATYTFKFKRII